jgi:hypothetical protein
MSTALEKLRKKYLAVSPALGERGRRLWAGAEADAMGYGGVALLARATGLAISTVRKGRDESRRPATLPLGRDRNPGAGRKCLEKKDPELLPALHSLVDPLTRGDPESPLRWTTKSLRVLSRAMESASHPVSPGKVGDLLRASGYSLQANVKTKEGAEHPDRNAQFELINAQAEDFLARGQPVISVDAKKKEHIGERAAPGREWQRKGEPVEVMTHDFFADGAPAAIPYGIYDVGRNLGYVNVGMDRNTPTFAVSSIGKWWEQLGRKLYPKANELFITADAGGSNAFRSNVFKSCLQEFADRTRLAIHVSHFPPGTSKWNKIEHRLFSFISLNWRGQPLISYELMISLIKATTTSKGLSVSAELDQSKYPVGVAVSKHRLANLRLERAAFHGEWNYVLRPRSASQRAADRRPPPSKTRTHAERNAFWREMISQQMQSGLNARPFCEQRGLHCGTFYSARMRLIGKIRKVGRSER